MTSWISPQNIDQKHIKGDACTTSGLQSLQKYFINMWSNDQAKLQEHRFNASFSKVEQCLAYIEKYDKEWGVHLPKR